jgi:7-cyano-7-deazaguanine reductase
VVPEFTCVCPMTGQPDFAVIRIRYSPDRWLVELKSLKLYMWSYRDTGAFHEDVTNRILDDLVGLLAPRRMEVMGDWNVRGGIKTVVTVRHPSASSTEPGSTGGPVSSPAPPGGGAARRARLVAPRPRTSPRPHRSARPPAGSFDVTSPVADVARPGPEAPAGGRVTPRRR